MTKNSALPPQIFGRSMLVFNSRIVCYVGATIVAGYCLIFISLVWHGYTLFGHVNVGAYDFSKFWAAGRLALAGKPAMAYDWPAIKELLIQAFPPEPSVEYGTQPFFYPPWFLLVLAPLGALHLPTAAAVWLAVTLGTYLLAMRAILPGEASLIAALAAPPVFFNLLSGQSGLLAAGLLGGALVLLDSKPVAAGILIGMLTYKPHFGLLLPVFLLLTGRWRVFSSACLTLTALVAIAGLLFGFHVWSAFAQLLFGVAADYGQHSLPGAGWADLASPYDSLRRLGIGNAAAWCGQAAIATPIALATLWIAASRARSDLKAASVATAAMIVTFYSEFADLAILTVSVAYIIRDGLLKGIKVWEIAALSLSFLTPLLYFFSILVGQGRGGHVVWLIGPPMCAILTIVIGYRAIADPGVYKFSRAAAESEAQ